MSAQEGEEGVEGVDQYFKILKENEKVLDDMNKSRQGVIEDLLDEISLEGLDGITLQTLWIRLIKRPNFGIAIEESTKSYIWSILIKLLDIDFYLLPEPRRSLEYYTRFDYYDETGNVFEPLSIQDEIYQYSSVEENDEKTNTLIRGSSTHYFIRQNISKYLRRENYSYDESHGRFGNGLVIVASQALREKALFGSEKIPELTIIQYCLMERIGRSRYEGESARGKISLGVMNIDPKTLFYHRKLLIAKNFIKKQSFIQKFGPNRVASLISIFHLPRFYSVFETSLSKNIKKIFNYIKSKPNYRCETALLKRVFGKNAIHHIEKNEFPELFISGMTPLFELKPEEFANAKPEKLKIYEKTFKTLSLVSSSLDIDAILASKKVEADPLDEEDEIDRGVCLPNKYLYSSYFTNITKEIIFSGSMGCTQSDIGDKFSLTTLEARSVVRSLVRYKIAATVLQDKKKTKVNRYLYVKFKGANKLVQQMGEQTQKKIIIANKDDVIIPNMDSSEIIPVVPINSESLIIPHDISDADHMIIQPESIVELDKEIEQQDDKHLKILFTKTEANEFVPDPDNNNEENSNFCFVSRNGWTVQIQTAAIGYLLSKKINYSSTVKNMERENFILNMVKKYKYIIGIQPFLKALRNYELKDAMQIDKKSLFRLFKYLHFEKKLQMWRVTLKKEEITRICPVFTDYDMPIDDPTIIDACEKITLSSGKSGKGKKGLDKRRRVITTQRNKEAKIKIKYKHMKFTNNGIEEEKRLIVRPKIRKVAKKVKIVKKNDAQRVLPSVPPAIISVSEFPESDDEILEQKGERNKYYDHRDMIALSKMQRKRVDWSADEDRFILFLFISSAIFLPKYNFRKIFIFNAAQIRDLFHILSPNSDHKTALAVRRRLHYLMKDKLFYTKYLTLINAAAQDKTIRKMIVKYGDLYSKKIFNHVPIKAIKEAFFYLFNKHNPDLSLKYVKQENEISEESDTEIYEEKNQNEEDLPMPLYKDTENENIIVNELNESVKENTKNVENLTLEPKSSADIERWVARSALLSVLFCRDEVDTTQNFLECISDDILESTIANLRNLGVTVISKASLKCSLSSALKRKFFVHLTPRMYRSCHETLKKIRNRSGELNEFNFSTVILFAELSRQKSINYKIFFPDSIITVNKEWRNLYNSLAQEEVKNFKTRKNIDSDDENDESEGEDNDEEEGVPTKRRKTAEPKIEIATPSDQEDENMDTAETSDVKPKLKGKKTHYKESKVDEPDSTRAYLLSISNQALRLLRTKVKNDANKDRIVEKDFFNVNLPMVKPSVNYDVIEDSEELGYEDAEKMKRLLNKILIIPVPSDTYPRLQIPKSYNDLYHVILTCGESGISLTYLKKKFRRELLIKALPFLIRQQYIFLVGTLMRKFVSYENILPWTMPVPKQGENDFIAQKVIMHSWITYQGHINYVVLDQMISTIIGIFSENPGSTIKLVFERLSPIFSSVEIIIILEIMVEFRLIRPFKITTSHQSNLFNLPKKIAKEYNIDTFIDLEECHFELEYNTVAKYSEIQELINPASNNSNEYEEEEEPPTTSNNLIVIQ